MTCRLVLEGGFLPDEITPRPPLRVEKTETPFRVDYDSDYQTQTEATILGGFKTKNVYIVVTKNGLGPVLAGRAGLRDDVSRYESIAFALVETVQPGVGDLNLDFPPADSPVRFNSFFSTLYQRYDERFVVSAPQLMHTTQRHEWSSDSPSFQSEIVADLDYQIRKSA